MVCEFIGRVIFILAFDVLSFPFGVTVTGPYPINWFSLSLESSMQTNGSDFEYLSRGDDGIACTMMFCITWN